MTEYLKGVFMKKKDGKYGEYFVLSFTEDGLNNLKALEKNQDGYRTVIATTRKDQPEKYSIKPFIKKNDPF